MTSTCALPSVKLCPPLSAHWNTTFPQNMPHGPYEKPPCSKFPQDFISLTWYLKHTALFWSYLRSSFPQAPNNTPGRKGELVHTCFIQSRGLNNHLRNITLLHWKLVDQTWRNYVGRTPLHLYVHRQTLEWQKKGKCLTSLASQNIFPTELLRSTCFRISSSRSAHIFALDNNDSKRPLFNIYLLCESVGLSLGVRFIYQSDGYHLERHRELGYWWIATVIK